MNLSAPEGYKFVAISPTEIGIVEEECETPVDISKIHLDKFDESIKYLEGFSKEQLLRTYNHYYDKISININNLVYILLVAYKDGYDNEYVRSVKVLEWVITKMSSKVVPYLIKNRCKDIINKVLYKYDCPKKFTKSQCIIISEALKDDANAEVYANLFTKIQKN